MAVETKIVQVRLGDLLLLERNARFMKPAQFKQLVENIQRDGCLTSVPLAIPAGQDRYRVISGNHRVRAGIKALGADHVAAVMVITSPIDDREAIAKQLAHNAISGQDDPTTLQELYQELDLALKEYSGLSDDMFKVPELNVTALGIGAEQLQELTVLFLPNDAKVFADAIKRMEPRAKKKPLLVAAYRDFDQFFDAVVRVKQQLQVHNTALAMRLMAELAVAQLDAETVAEAGQMAATAPEQP